jgi:hypothetical protein
MQGTSEPGQQFLDTAVLCEHLLGTVAPPPSVFPTDQYSVNLFAEVAPSQGAAKELAVNDLRHTGR